MKLGSPFTLINDYWQDRESRKRMLIVLVLIGLYILIVPNLFWERTAEKELSELTAKYH